MRYFRRDAESELGEGEALMETDPDLDLVVRQIAIYGEAIFWSTPDQQSDDRFMIADQPVSCIDLTAEYEIPRAEFETMWRRAVDYAN